MDMVDVDNNERGGTRTMKIKELGYINLLNINHQTRMKITNKAQLKIAEDKIYDLAEFIMKTYHNKP